MTLIKEDLDGVVGGLHAIARAVNSLSDSIEHAFVQAGDKNNVVSELRRLGTGSAVTEGWGALELLGKHVSDAISGGLGDIAQAIKEKDV